jgi:hypothetical protein
VKHENENQNLGGLPMGDGCKFCFGPSREIEILLKFLFSQLELEFKVSIQTKYIFEYRKV